MRIRLKARDRNSTQNGNQYGMSDNLGPLFLGGYGVFVGRDFAQHSNLSTRLPHIDDEVKAIIETQYDALRR